jgi:alkanesulfonate monooxygenase SsuD/methylene tetrahydromethanopterin reductase-like flavin-dependent oxidoreductase (luciferase family)
MAMTLGIDLHNRACVFFPKHGLDYDLGRLIDLAVLCEELGFSSVSVGDSLLAKPRWRPIPTMAAIAARTRHITVASHILTPQFYNNPVILAQELVTLDEIARGRVALGCGIGAGKTAAVEAEYQAVGLPKRRRGAVFEETLEILRRLWTEDEVTFHGQFYHLEHVSLGLKPRGPLPFWIAAGLFHAGVAGQGPFGDREADQGRRGWFVPHERVARLGDGWLSTQATPAEYAKTLGEIRELAATKYGRPPGSVQGIFSLGVYIDSDVERAYEQTRWFQREYHEMPVPEEVMRRWTIAGTAEQCIRQLQAYEAAGVEHFIICVRSRDYFAQVRQLAAEILPAFARREDVVTG